MCECHRASSPNSLSESFSTLEFERGIWYAALFGDLDRVQSLLDKGIEVDERDASGYTALHYASRNGHLEICKLLVKKGADVNATTPQGKATPLHRAASAGKDSVVKCLMSYGADCLLKDADGKTALHRAAEEQHLEICDLLKSSHPELKQEPDNKDKLPIDYTQTLPLQYSLCE